MCHRWSEREIDNLLFVEYAKSKPDEEKIKILLNFGADINAVDNKGETLLFNAIGNVCYGLDTKYIRLLIDEGVDLSYTVEGMNCLYIALMSGNPEIVSILLEAGADPNCISGDQPASLLDWAEAKLLFEEFCHGCDLLQLKQIIQQLKSYGARSITRMIHGVAEELPLGTISDLSIQPYLRYKEV